MYYRPQVADDKIFATSDWHLLHKNLAKGSSKWNDVSGCRNFKNQHEMTDVVIETTNKYVPKDGLIIHCGDIFLDRDEQKLGQLLSRINCKQIINIVGNHDHKVDRSYFTLWTDVLEFKSGGFEYFFSHYAHVIWNKKHRGTIHGYGHSHSSMEEYLDKLWPERRSMDVGIDNAFRLFGEYRPFSLIEIRDRLGSRPLVPLDHHGA